MTTTRYISKCKGCSLHTSALANGQEPRTNKPADGVVYTHPVTGDFVINCRGCKAPRVAKFVRGKFSAKHVCNAKCLASTGHSCECSCGGRNHGASYAGAA